MKISSLCSMTLLLCGTLFAQEKAAEKVEMTTPPLAPAETKKEEPKAAPAPEAKAEWEISEPKPREAAAASAKEGAAPSITKAGGGPEGELAYLKWASEQDSSEARQAVIEDLEGFIIRRRDDEWGQQAQLLLAETIEKKGDHYEAVLQAAKFLYEYPDSKFTFQAKRAFADLVEKRMSRKIKPALLDLADVPTSPDKAQRLALLIHAIVDKAGDYFLEPLEEDFSRFQTRFPDYPQSDQMLLELGLLRAKNSKFDAAVLPYKKLLALYPQSAYRSQAQWEIGDLYGEHTKDYNKAVDAFRDLVELYPKDSRVELSLQKMAQLLSDRLKHYDMALDIDERIAKEFPNTHGARRALEDAARLQRDRLSHPLDAIKTCQRLAAMFHTASGVEALQLAAKIARKDLKNYTLEIELHKQAAADFADFQEAPGELFSAAEVYEDDLGDLDSASKTYSEVASKFPAHKLAGKAQNRIEKIQKKKAN